jgi:heterokaryon incompatibility protein (HET)
MANLRIPNLKALKAKRGWAKIEKSCSQARHLGLHYVWVDTCCIDKSSSAELTEAINSMYRWYQESSVCFAFMEGLPADPEFQNADPKDEVLSKDKLVSDLLCCRWFSRGWTLQELIAPRDLVFYDESWVPRGSKHTLSEDLSRITGIDLAVLQGGGDLLDVPVARRMAWAALRKTTRVEDLAYCLLGIFDVNMPLIYGEGKKAFIRLQEAIAQSTDDFSLFAWSSVWAFRLIGACLPSLHRNSGIAVNSSRFGIP